MELTKEDMEIKRLFQNGFKTKEISGRVGLPEKVVSYRINRMRNNGIEVERWWKR